MRKTVSFSENAAYFYFTDQKLERGRDTYAVPMPPGVNALVYVDWKDGALAGIEVIGLSALYSDAIEDAEVIG